MSVVLLGVFSSHSTYMCHRICPCSTNMSSAAANFYLHILLEIASKHRVLGIKKEPTVLYVLVDIDPVQSQLTTVQYETRITYIFPKNSSVSWHGEHGYLRSYAQIFCTYLCGKIQANSLHGFVREMVRIKWLPT